MVPFDVSFEGRENRQFKQSLLSELPGILAWAVRGCLAWLKRDVFERSIVVGRAKTASGTGRVIPINNDLVSILAAHRAWFISLFGEPKPEHYLFPWGKSGSFDPTRHVTDITAAWERLRSDADVRWRLHDLRHTFATRLAENGVSESTMLALMGHMSRAMLERYSHIRMAAKRDAMAGITLRPRGSNSEAVPVKVPVPAEVCEFQ